MSSVALQRLSAQTDERCARMEAERNEARQQCAMLQGELRALEASSEAERAAVREERATLRAAIDAAEARAAIALNQVASIGHDRSVTRQELADLRLAMEVAAESAAKREHESGSQVALAEQIARQMAERCRAAERKAEVRSRSPEEDDSLQHKPGYPPARTMPEGPHPLSTLWTSRTQLLAPRDQRETPSPRIPCSLDRRTTQVQSLLLDEAMSSAESGASAASRSEAMLQIERQRVQAAQVGVRDLARQRYEHTLGRATVATEASAAPPARAVAGRQLGSGPHSPLGVVKASASERASPKGKASLSPSPSPTAMPSPTAPHAGLLLQPRAGAVAASTERAAAGTPEPQASICAEVGSRTATGTHAARSRCEPPWWWGTGTQSDV